MPEIPDSRQRPWLPWLRPERLFLLLVILTAALAMSPNVADPDLWGHVQFGRDVLNEGSIPATTSYSYTANGYRWVNHENLSEIVMAVVADSLGPLGLVVGKFLLSLLVILVILRWNLVQGCGLVVSSLITLLVATNLGYHWSIRPQLSSFVCFTLLILLFQFCFTGWRGRWHVPVPRRWFQESSPPRQTVSPGGIREQLGYDSTRLRFLWLLVPLMMVWANAHGGFVAGLAVTGFYLGCRAMEALFRGQRRQAANTGWGLVRRMSLMLLVAVVATLLNPYGPGLHGWLLMSLGTPRPEISDWASNPLWTLVGMKFWVLLGCGTVALLLSRNKRDATETVILLLLLWQSLSHFRHVPFFAIAAGFWIGPHLQSALQRVAHSPVDARLNRPWQAAFSLVLIIGIVAVGGRLGHRLSDLRVERDRYPVDALEFMRCHALAGRIVVTYDWAQYTIAALCSDHRPPRRLSRVAFDGRFRTCYPQTVVDMHFDFLYGDSPRMPRQRSPQSPPIDAARVLHYGQPDLVLLRRFGERTESHMADNADTWVLLYQDAIAQVWGRQDRYDRPASASYLPPEKRTIHSRRRDDSVTWPAIRQLEPARIPDHLAGRAGG